MYCSSPVAACASLASEYSVSQSKSRSSFPMCLLPRVVAPVPSLQFASQMKPSPLQLTTRLSTLLVLERPGPILPTRLIFVEFFFLKPVLSCHGEKRRSQSAEGQASAPVTTATMKLKPTVIGGSATNFLAQSDPLRTVLLQNFAVKKGPCKMIASTLLLSFPTLTSG